MAQLNKTDREGGGEAAEERKRPESSTDKKRSPSKLAPSTKRGRGLSTAGAGTAAADLMNLQLDEGEVLFDQWKVGRKLGQGGFGTVYEAVDLKFNESVAIKFLDPKLVGHDETLKRFRAEVFMMRRLAHPRIVRVYDYRENLRDSMAMISMERVDGCSVGELSAMARSRGGVHPLLIWFILVQILEALIDAHRQRVIHRDVTPGNVLLGGGTPENLLTQLRDPLVKLVDFGIAAVPDRGDLSNRTRMIGTAPYMAPEVFNHDAKISSAADVYSAGAVVFQLLTGEVPGGRMERVPKLDRLLPKRAVTLLLGFLNRDPIARPSAENALIEVCRVLPAIRRRRPKREWVGGEPAILFPTRNVRSLQKNRIHRRDVIAAFVGVALTVAVWWGAGLTQRSGDDPSRGRSAKLEIRANVDGGTIYLDGRPEAVTPAILELPPGSHRVVVRKKNCEDGVELVDLEPGEARTVRMNLTCGMGFEVE